MRGYNSDDLKYPVVLFVNSGWVEVFGSRGVFCHWASGSVEINNKKSVYLRVFDQSEKLWRIDCITIVEKLSLFERIRDYWSFSPRLHQIEFQLTLLKENGFQDFWEFMLKNKRKVIYSQPFLEEIYENNPNDFPEFLKIYSKIVIP